MLKKFFTWGLYLAFVAFLVVGGINRTFVKFETSLPAQRGNANADSANFGANPEVSKSAEHDEHADGEPKALMILTGQVETVRQGRVTVMTESNEPFELAGRSWRYAQSLGFSVQVGDLLSFEGFDEEGSFKIVSLMNITNGKSAQVRDVSGHPLWEGDE
ncbi:MAG: hypothetical protein L6461_14370 [Anaerolineae bacterium]|nr:hypothetical protein [Anaerolineae bacterium]